MVDPKCVVQVGIHPGPYWRDTNSGLVVCSRHRTQYEERADEFGPFDWERQPRAVGRMGLSGNLHVDNRPSEEAMAEQQRMTEAYYSDPDV